MPKTLRNLEPVGGKVTGFRFSYRVYELRTMYFATHRMILLLNGAVLPRPRLHVTFKGVTVSAENLPETDWVALRGEVIEIAVELPGGLRPGQHQVRVEAVFGGGFGGGMPAAVLLAEFSDVIE
ncbi:MAG: hypothetical protein FJ399_16120 [Verrucomicrobia bacterium]|nr:hypothetical protein [Verrucomicrobiota bacterium]